MGCKCWVPMDPSTLMPWLWIIYPYCGSMGLYPRFHSLSLPLSPCEYHLISESFGEEGCHQFFWCSYHGRHSNGNAKTHKVTIKLNICSLIFFDRRVRISLSFHPYDYCVSVKDDSQISGYARQHDSLFLRLFGVKYNSECTDYELHISVCVICNVLYVRRKRINKNVALCIQLFMKPAFKQAVWRKLASSAYII